MPLVLLSFESFMETYHMWGTETGMPINGMQFIYLEAADLARLEEKAAKGELIYKFDTGIDEGATSCIEAPVKVRDVSDIMSWGCEYYDIPLPQTHDIYSRL